jgi:hypothetical protein
VAVVAVEIIDMTGLALVLGVVHPVKMPMIIQFKAVVVALHLLVELLRPIIMPRMDLH